MKGSKDKKLLELRERSKTLLVRSSDDPILLVCRDCGGLFVFDEMNLDYYTSEGLRFPDKCINCLEGVRRYL